jgi:DNA-binding NtrC family response regulator
MDGIRVLLIEDDELLRTAVAEWLQQDGYCVSVAATGTEGLQRAADGADVVVLDYNLPDFDGFEVLRRLQSAHPRLPVVMFTGHASFAHVVEAMKRGAFHYLPKPADLEELSRVVRQAAAAGAARAEAPASDDGDPARMILGPAPAASTGCRSSACAKTAPDLGHEKG